MTARRMRALLAVLEHHSIVLSTTVFTEISEVLGRQKFAAAVTPERRQEILALLTGSCRRTWIEPEPDRDGLRGSGRQRKYLELAIVSGATVVVSSDRHLLQMHPWRGVAILRPAEYLMRS